MNGWLSLSQTLGAEDEAVSAYVKTILRDLGVAAQIPGLMALCTIPICFLFDELYAVPAFLLTALVSLAFGQALYWVFRSADEMRIRHAMDTAVLAWLFAFLFGMLPFLIVSRVFDAAQASETLLLFRDPWNSLFEAVSGFTSTGLTVALRPEELPSCLQWWRSFMQWVGGVGVIVLMLSVFHPSRDAHRLFLAEAREKTITPSVAKTVRTIWWIYLLFTALSVFALRLAGMSWWHAINYGMTGIATGGFGTTSGNVGEFAAAPRIVLMAIIIIGAMSFDFHYRLLAKRHIAILWRNTESRLLFSLLAVGGFLLILENAWQGRSVAVLDGLFHWISALCTAGFQSADLGEWSPTARFLLTIGMIIGGVAGSTAGGLKLFRIAILTQGAIDRATRVARQPWRLAEHRPIGDPEEAALHKRNLEAAAILAVLWVAFLVCGTLILLHVARPGASFDEAMLEVASAIGNVGLSAGITHPNLPWLGKLTLMLMMWIGRLEIIPVLVFVSALVPRRSH